MSVPIANGPSLVWILIIRSALRSAPASRTHTLTGPTVS